MKIILPGSTIGIIGGGQLGRMLAMSAREMGYRVHILDPQNDCCAKDFAHHFIQASFDDIDALEQLCQQSDVVTFEFENINCDHLEVLEQRYYLVQHSSVLRISQHRLYEKQFAASLKIPTVDYIYVGDEGLNTVLSGKYLMKTVRFGYDGKGQKVIDQVSEVEPQTLLEQIVPLDKEISVVAVKDIHGVEIVAVVENEHRHHILYRSQIPTTATRQQEQQAINYTIRILETLNYYGVLTVEFFISQGQVIFNEIAPRVHNSGHITMLSANKSQFKAHIEAICGLPVGAITHQPTTMYNILGQDLDKFIQLRQNQVGQLHLYEKAPRTNRKIGHINFEGIIHLGGQND